jgi:signal transduction histidine kinase
MNTESASPLPAFFKAMQTEALQSAVHDLRSPMTVIKGNLQVLLSGFLGEMTPDQQMLIKRSVGPLEELILMTENLLQAGKLDRNEISLKPQPCDLDKLLAEIVEFYQLPFQQRDMRIFRDGNTLGLFLNIDAIWIKRVLHNLIWNAYKFTPDHGQVMLRVDHETPELKIFIEDTGRGIPADKMARIFEKFEQCELTDRKIGTGLGLWICKKVLELHGGSIRAESQGGLGSRFILSFPPSCIL